MPSELPLHGPAAQLGASRDGGRATAFGVAMAAARGRSAAMPEIGSPVEVRNHHPFEEPDAGRQQGGQEQAEHQGKDQVRAHGALRAEGTHAREHHRRAEGAALGGPNWLPFVG